MDIVNERVLQRSIELCRERQILLPTFAQMRDPGRIPARVLERLKQVGLWDVDPVNLFRITWKNEPVDHGGLFNQGNWIEFPSQLTGVDATIVGLIGKYFPTGSHKVGAAFGCLVPRLVTGRFDPTRERAVWPSTGNFCRGGAFDSALLGCTAVAILPEEMSRERFDWLQQIGAEIIATKGSESNVKEIYDKCWEIRATRPDCVIFNQFEEFGNSAWHYHVSGAMIEEVFSSMGCGKRLSGYVSASGSAGTVAAGDRLKKSHPQIRVAVAEAWQCPTLYQCGFGSHRIEGIGDKHIPWIHNVRNTDVVTAVDDEQCLNLFRLFNEPAGLEVLADDLGFETASQLSLLGISGICNVVAAVQLAKYYEMDNRDVIVTCLTDSADLYASRIEELIAQHGELQRDEAIRIQGRHLHGISVDHFRELSYRDRKSLHNFKYFTWVEQQGRTTEELDQLWDPDFWERTYAEAAGWDDLIESFNQQTGVLSEWSDDG